MSKQTIELIDGKIKVEDVFLFLPEGYNYIAMDEDRNWNAFKDKPIMKEGYWFRNPESNEPVHCISFSNIYDPEGFTDALYGRPKELKPVNNNCCGKKILVKDHDDDEWIKRIFICLHFLKTGYACFTSHWSDRFSNGFSVDVFADKEAMHIWTSAKRCPDVIYGDEDE